MRYLLDTNVCVMYLNGRSASIRDGQRPIAYYLNSVAIALRMSH